MSGSSSTTRTRYACRAGAAPRAAAGSFIDDLHVREVVRVLADAGDDRRGVGRLGAVLDALADLGYLGEAVGVADALHAMAELAQLLEIGCGEGGAQGFDLFLAVLEEYRDQVGEVLRDRDGQGGSGHLVGDYRGFADAPPGGLSKPVIGLDSSMKVAR